MQIPSKQNMPLSQAGLHRLDWRDASSKFGSEVKKQNTTLILQNFDLGHRENDLALEMFSWDLAAVVHHLVHTGSSENFFPVEESSIGFPFSEIYL